MSARVTTVGHFVFLIIVTRKRHVASGIVFPSLGFKIELVYEAMLVDLSEHLGVQSIILRYKFHDAPSGLTLFVGALDG